MLSIPRAPNRTPRTPLFPIKSSLRGESHQRSVNSPERTPKLQQRGVHLPTHLQLQLWLAAYKEETADAVQEKDFPVVKLVLLYRNCLGWSCILIALSCGFCFVFFFLPRSDKAARRRWNDKMSWSQTQFPAHDQVFDGMVLYRLDIWVIEQPAFGRC